MDWLTLIGFAGAVMAAASTGAMFPPGRWYDALVKPNWTPPNWVFPVAWTVLYSAMAYAANRVSRTDAALAAPAVAFFVLQLVLNAVWSPVFFGLRRLGAAMVVLSLLWLSIAVMIWLFLRADLIAGLLVAPYIVWASYAGALNWWIWRANPGVAAPAEGG